MVETGERGPGTGRAAAPGNQQYSTFFVADLFFGVDVLDVQEVLRTQPLTPIPQAPGVIVGLMNLRGQIVTAIDMRKRLGLQARGGARDSTNVVVRTPDGPVSLLVDEIGDVLDTGAATWQPPPENLDRATRTLIRGVYPLRDCLLLVLDTERTVDLAMARADRNAGRGAEPMGGPGVNNFAQRSTGTVKARAEKSRGVI
jgi:purine-binding chemotaxis protein CheW